MIEYILGGAAAVGTSIASTRKITSGKHKQKVYEKYTEKYIKSNPDKDPYAAENNDEFEEGLKKASNLDIIKSTAISVFVSTAVGIATGVAVAGIKSLLNSDDNDDTTETEDEEE